MTGQADMKLGYDGHCQLVWCFMTIQTFSMSALSTMPRP